MFDRFGNYIPDYTPRTPGSGQFSKVVEVIQIEGEDAVANAVVTANEPKIYITRDERTVIVKSVGPAGYVTDYYDKRPPAPPVQQPVYITMEQAEALIDQRLGIRQQQQPVPQGKQGEAVTRNGAV